jgi:ribosomal protein S18 acetylase RimI-like enzyme
MAAVADDGLLTFSEGVDAADAVVMSALLLRELPAFYDDVDESLPKSLADTSRRHLDPNGYFTLRRKIFVARQGGAPVGFTVATFKRGGSVKIGPTAVLPDQRGRGIASALRRHAEEQLVARYGARKLYLTVPTTNTPALMFNLGLGFQVEGVLSHQYQAGRAELVLGRFPQATCERRTEQARLGADPEPARACTWTDASASLLAATFCEPLQEVFDDIDRSFFEAIVAATAPSRQSFAAKGKQLIVGEQHGGLEGMCVFTPKRGGAVKLAPVVTGERNVARSMVQHAVDIGRSEGRSKLYAHVPLCHADMNVIFAELGFRIEAQLRSPYKPGIDVLVHGRML